MTWSLLLWPLKVPNPISLRKTLCPRQNVFKIRRRGSWVRKFFKTVLQQVHHIKVDVIAGDANAAAYRYYKRQEYQYLYNSSVAVMLRDAARGQHGDTHVKADFRLIFYHNQHFSQLRSANDLDCCFMAILSWRKPTQTLELRENSGATRVCEHRVTRKDKIRTARTPNVLKSCRGKRLARSMQTQRASTIP